MTPSDESIALAALLQAEDPVEHVSAWLLDATQAGVRLPDRACLATVSADGSPAARMVLVKSIGNGQFVFFTDYRSRKATELTADPRAALVFYWQRLGRQVRVEGNVSRLDRASSERYFATRRRGSRISAWASHQSAQVRNRRELEHVWNDFARRFADAEVPCPDHWGGFVILPTLIEFWQEREDRLHDRLVFRRESTGWARSTLQP